MRLGGWLRRANLPPVMPLMPAQQKPEHTLRLSRCAMKIARGAGSNWEGELCQTEW